MRWLIKVKFFDGLFAISHEFTPDINSNCINVKSGAVILVQNAHGGFSPMNRLRGISAANILFAAENRLVLNISRSLGEIDQ